MPPKHEIHPRRGGHRKKYEPIPKEVDEIGKKIVHAAYLVHKALGPGLLEKVYEICLCHELRKMGLNAERQIDIPRRGGFMMD